MRSRTHVSGPHIRIFAIVWMDHQRPIIHLPWLQNRCSHWLQLCKWLFVLQPKVSHTSNNKINRIRFLISVRISSEMSTKLRNKSVILLILQSCLVEWHRVRKLLVNWNWIEILVIPLNWQCHFHTNVEIYFAKNANKIVSSTRIKIKVKLVSLFCCFGTYVTHTYYVIWTVPIRKWPHNLQCRCVLECVH